MNRLKTDYNQGIGAEWDDFRFAEQAVREAFKGLLTGLRIASKDCFIISGCEISGLPGSETMTEGFVNLFGEVCKVDAQAIPVPNPGEDEYWQVVTTYDSSGLENFDAGGSGETYEVRKAQILAGVFPGATVAIKRADMPQLPATLVERFAAINWANYYPWKQVHASNGWGINSDFTPTWCYFRKDMFGMVTLAGEFVCNVANGVLADLPASLLPSVTNTSLNLHLAINNNTGVVGMVAISNQGGTWRLLRTGGLTVAPGEIILIPNIRWHTSGV